MAAVWVHLPALDPDQADLNGGWAHNGLSRVTAGVS